MTNEELFDLAKKLAIALADEINFIGTDAADASVSVMIEAIEKLKLEIDTESFDSLKSII